MSPVAIQRPSRTRVIQLRAGTWAGDQDPTVAQECRRVAVARSRHVPGRRPAAGARVVQLRAAYL